MYPTDQSIRFGGRLMAARTPLEMAIINATPDSFFAASRAGDEAAVRSALLRAVSEGADIIDIGACSTRPAVQASTGELADEQHEWARLSMALRVARQTGISVPLSVDTFRPAVARRAVDEYGVAMINDVSGGSDEMFALAAQTGVAYVLMYNRTNDERKTDRLLSDALAFFSRQTDELHRRGVSDVIIDPGFGFGQSVQESLSLLDNLRALQHIGCPVLAGISRKRMAYEPAGLTPDTCLSETLRLERKALEQGAAILRVHDVAATKQLINSEK